MPKNPECIAKNEKLWQQSTCIISWPMLVNAPLPFPEPPRCAGKYSQASACQDWVNGQINNCLRSHDSVYFGMIAMLFLPKLPSQCIHCPSTAPPPFGMPSLGQLADK
jgi:hypothetical protein